MLPNKKADLINSIILKRDYNWDYLIDNPVVERPCGETIFVSRISTIESIKYTNSRILIIRTKKTGQLHLVCQLSIDFRRAVRQMLTEKGMNNQRNLQYDKSEIDSLIDIDCPFYNTEWHYPITYNTWSIILEELKNIHLPMIPCRNGHIDSEERTVWIKHRRDYTVNTNNNLVDFTVPSPSNLCPDAAPYQLVGNPTGGTFSGTGVIGNYFYPANVLAGRTYNITYSVPNACASTTTKDIDVIPIKPLLTTNKDSICVGESITYTALGGTPITFFKNNILVQGPGTNYKYVTSQLSHGDAVYVSSSYAGCTNYSDTIVIPVNANPKVDFTISDYCAGKSANTFTSIATIPYGTSTVSNVQWYMDIGTGYSAYYPSGNSVSHLFAAAGTHEVKSVVTLNTGCSNLKDSSFVMGAYPSSAFSWKSTCGQNTITFHDLSSITGGSTITKWDWDYTNDGTIDYTQLTSLPDAVYTYPITNTYQSRLRVTTDKGCYNDTVIRVYTLPGKTPTPTDPYAINFASSNQGWAYDGTNSSWGWGIAPSSFGMGTRTIWSTGQNSPDGNYKIAEHSYLYGPCINFSQLDKPMIAMKLSSKITANPAGAILEATSDDGLNWVKLGNIGEGLNWYNVAGIVSTPFTYLANSTDNNPLAQGWADTISFNNAKIPKLGLQSYAGNTSVRFRINFAAVANVSAPRFAGIGIDSVWIGNRNKIALIEHFTNTSSLCLAADSAINLINTKRPKDVVSIYYHSSFPDYDPLSAFDDADVSSRVLDYGLSNVPYTVLEGDYYRGNTYFGGTSSARIDTTDIDAVILNNAIFKIDLTTIIVGNNVTANARVTYTDSKTILKDLNLRVVVVEDTAGGNPKYNYVSRKMLPDKIGTYLGYTWTPGSVAYVTDTWTSTLLANAKLKVVAFVQDGGDPFEVYQVAYVEGSGTFGSTVVTSNNEKINAVQNLYIYPNPASTIVNIAFEEVLKEEVNWQMTDNFGKIVKEGTIKESTLGYQIDTNELANGMYYIKLANENINQIRKLIINK
jgi:hypothetical protein